MDRHFAVVYTAIEQRRHALATEAMFGAGQRDAIVQPGIEEALAPVKLSLIARALLRLRLDERGRGDDAALSGAGPCDRGGGRFPTGTADAV